MGDVEPLAAPALALGCEAEGSALGERESAGGVGVGSGDHEAETDASGVAEPVGVPLVDTVALTVLERDAGAEPLPLGDTEGEGADE